MSAQNPVYSSISGVLFNKSQSRLIQYPEASVITSYTIPESVTEIGAYAFANSDLTSVTIPDSVSIIGGAEFLGCNNLTVISVSAQNPIYSSVNGVVFDKNQTTLIQFPCGKSGSYIIPDGVTSIGGYAFAYCERIVSVTIPGSVNNIERGAFWACTNLTSVYFMGDLPYMVDQDAFNGFETPNQIVPYDPATLYYLPGTFGWSGFAVNIFIPTPTALWLPQVQTDDGSFGVKNNQCWLATFPGPADRHRRGGSLHQSGQSSVWKTRSNLHPRQRLDAYFSESRNRQIFPAVSTDSAHREI